MRFSGINLNSSGFHAYFHKILQNIDTIQILPSNSMTEDCQSIAKGPETVAKWFAYKNDIQGYGF